MKTILFPVVIILSLFLFSCSEKTTQPYANTVATPTFTLQSGIYLQGQLYSISCETPEVTIKYTTDGSEPNKKSKTFAEPFTIQTSTIVQAMAFKKGWNQSATASAFYEIHHNSGVTADITRIKATPDTIYADNGASYSTIKVTVKDADQYALPGKIVSFQTTMGNIISSATTDEYGIASTTFKAEDETGVAKIMATVRNYHPDHPEVLVSSDRDSVYITVTQAPPVTPTVHSIQFTHSGHLDLDVINTGGISSAPLAVRLLDRNGNPVTEPHNVWFKIINPVPPAGVNLDNHAFMDSVMTISNNGIAKVTINSGSGSGMVAVKVSCTSGGNYITATKPDVYINSATPRNIVVFSTGYNTGENMAGGFWRIVVGAIVTDINNNPVGYGTSIWFSLPDNVTNCMIQANAYTGNESIYGDSTAGIAYTTLTYSGYYTFESIKLRAATGSQSGIKVIGENNVVLPLNQPQLELEIVPGNLVFHGNTNPIPASATATINVSVFDIQGCPIHNARILLTSNHGVFEYTPGTNIDPLNCNQQSTPYILVTDWYDATAVEIPGDPDTYTDISGGQEGLAQGLIRFYAWEIPFADPMVNHPAATAVTLTARIMGTSVESSCNTVLIRYPT